MKHFTIILIIILSTFSLFGQDKSVLKSVKKYDGKKLRLILNYDKCGNSYFQKHDGLFGKVIMIFGTDFDSLNREIRTISAHCNVGFDIKEIKYSPFKIETYYHISPNFVPDSNYKTKNYFHPYESIDTVDSKEELESLENIKNLQLENKYLYSIVFLDEKNNKSQKFTFEENGDTTIEVYKNKEWVIEKYANANEEKYKTDVVEQFDLNGNLIKSLRTQANGITEDYYYKYSKTNKRLEEIRFINKSFDYKLVNVFNSKGQKVKEYYYEKDPDKFVRIKKYKYNGRGNEIKEVCYDLRKDKPELTYTYITKYEYWRK
jgi:hypothetical protein